MKTFISVQGCILANTVVGPLYIGTK
jgi:hypothetical protein